MGHELTVAQDALNALEAPKRRVTHAMQELATLEGQGEPSNQTMRQARSQAMQEISQELSEANQALAEQVSAAGGDAALQRQIEAASQAILTARGEGHTEKAVG